jgi:hypothetical protein
VADLVAATKRQDSAAMVAVLGPGSGPIVASGDPVADRDERARFVAGYEEANKIEKDGDAKAVLVVGKQGWPFPIPIVKDGNTWHFDAAAGREEILNRRIGYNELSVMQAMLAYVDAQFEYYLLNPRKDKLRGFARRLVSSKGARDGLYFPTKPGEPESPLGPLFAAASAEGYGLPTGTKAGPYFGYHFRILTAQGPDADGGAYSYVVNGRMLGGHALVAWPAAYGNSGVMTFIVNHDGVVYERDLGPQTDATARKMTKFDPDKGWRRVEAK